MIKNGNTPRQSPVQKKIKDMLEEFILNTELITPTLGHKVFDPLPSENDENSDEDCLYMFDKDRKSIMATGKIEDDGFWLLKDSRINHKIACWRQKSTGSV